MVWPGEGLQCASHGPAGAQSRGPLQLLWPQIHHENCPYAGRSGNVHAPLTYTCLAFIDIN